MHRVLLAIACATALTGAVAAQGRASTAPAQTSTASGGAAGQHTAAANNGRVVLTGCIDRADQLTPVGGSTLGTTVDSLDFVMTHAELADGPHPVTPEPKGTSGTAAPGYNGIGAIYRLDGPTATLNPHVGQRVEITGTRAGVPGTKPPSANAVNPSAADAPIIRVESVKLLSESCPQ